MNAGKVIASAHKKGKDAIDSAKHLFKRKAQGIGDDYSDRNGNDDDSLAFQLIDEQGSFNPDRLIKFVKEAKFSKYGCSYAIVAVLGPQSSGKSTLLNHLFGTNFSVMNNSEGRSQTTKGIWLARSLGMEPLTLVMDIEGTDGSERGEDYIAFEKQSTLFALAVADIVLINMWCHDIGRQHAANKPLLKVIFQQVLVRFCDKPRKITLMFVIRDKTKSPEDKLEDILRRDLEKIWDSIPKPSGSTDVQLLTFFEVVFEFLPNYEAREEEFKSKVENLKGRFFASNALRGLLTEGKEPASGFRILAEKIWTDIVENRDLDLPAHKVMVATIRCEEIINEKYDSFEINELWYELRKEVQFGFVPEFGKRVDSIVNVYVQEYNAETSYFDKEVTTKKRRDLIDKVLKLAEPAYRVMLNHLRLKHLNKFMDALDKKSDDEKSSIVAEDHVNSYLLEFDKDCTDHVRIERAKWDAWKERAKLQRDMKSYIDITKRDEKLDSKIRRLFKPKLKHELSHPMGFLLCEETDPNWLKIREHFKRVMDSTCLSLENTLKDFDVDEEGRKERLESIKKYAEDIVEAKARVESSRVKYHMLKKFVRLFKYDYDSSPDFPCDWNSIEEIEAAAKNVLCAAPLHVLAGLAAIRQADDDILHRLSSALLGSADPMTLDYQNAPPHSEEQSTLNDLDIISWPLQLWKEYLIEARDFFIKAMNDFQKKQMEKPRWEQILKQALSIMKSMLERFEIDATDLTKIIFDQDTLVLVDGIA